MGSIRIGGLAMKKIFVISLIFLVFIMSQFGFSISTKSAEKSFPLFKVLAVKSVINGGSTTITFEKPIPIMEYNIKGFIFYEVRRIKDGENSYDMPVLDNQGNPVPLKTSDPKYLDKLRLTMWNDLGCYTTGNQSQSMTIYVYNKTLKDGYELIGKELSEGNLGSSSFAKALSGTTIKHPLGTYVYNDSNMNFEVGEYTKKGYEIRTRISYNPDTFDKHSIHGSNFGSFDSAFGYLWLQTANEKYYAGGKEGAFFYKEIPQLKNGKLAIPLKVFSNLLYCKINNEDDTMTVYKLKERPFKDDCFIKVEFSTKKDIVIVGDKEIKMPFMPYRIEQTYEVMVPLVSFCEALGFKYYWRQFDNSILIERFSRY